VRTIRLGDKSENYFIVLEGLKAGERVIVEGMQKAKPGSEVRPTSDNLAREVPVKKAGG
jgi:membrane fusion protein (multidrug efflux system)